MKKSEAIFTLWLAGLLGLGGLVYAGPGKALQAPGVIGNLAWGHASEIANERRGWDFGDTLLSDWLELLPALGCLDFQPCHIPK